MTVDELYDIFLRHPAIQTDTRKLKPGELYFALRGNNFNGNQFAEDAIAKGAAFAIVDEPLENPSDQLIVVDNVLTALQDLARYHREQFSIPFLAITGSNGKTTTKELIHAVLSMQKKTYTTQGNLNNHIGIPLTLVSVKKDAEIAVIEMGANHRGEIASYCEYTLPTHGIITNCGKAHLEGFGSIEGVRKGKGELFDHLRENNGTAFVNWDDAVLQTMSKGIPRVIRYGSGPDSTVVGFVEKVSPFLSVAIQSASELTVIHTRLTGDYNLPNVLAAVAVGRHFDIPEEAIAAAIANYTPNNQRSQLVEKNGTKIILDSYNANPSSMVAAIQNLAQLPGNNKILILGSMAELGKESLEEHEQLVDVIRRYSWSHVVLVGEEFSKIKHPFLQLKNSAEAKAWFSEQNLNGAYVLVKGSRSMQMEKVIE